MKKKRKAFTLIELLAVIIVLAIIALIAMPIIFNVIENAKVKSLENSAYGVVDAVRLQYMEDLMNSEDGTVPLSGSVTSLTLSGEHPTGGRWEIKNGKDVENGRGIKISGVTFASMEGYVCNSVIENGKLTGKVKCAKPEGEIVFEIEDGIINENGWANDFFDIKVTANGASSMKICYSETGECDMTIPEENGGMKMTMNLYSYTVNSTTCLSYLQELLGSENEATFLCNTPMFVEMLEVDETVDAETLEDAGVITDLEKTGEITKSYGSDGYKGLLNINSNTVTLHDSIYQLLNEGSNYFCAEAEGLERKCESYNIDPYIPELVVKEENPTVFHGQNVEMMSFFEEEIFGPSDGNVVCKDTNNNEITNTSGLELGSHTVTCKAIGNNGLNSDDVSLTIKVEELIKEIAVDVNSNGVADLGDEIRIGNEYFYVLTNDGTNIRMIAKYRIDVSDNTTRKERLQLPSGEAEKLHTVFSSETVHGTNPNSYEGSIVEDLVGDYKTTLEGFGVTINDATLVSYDEVISAPFNCKEYGGLCAADYSWIYKDGNTTGASHWTRTGLSGNTSLVWEVNSMGVVYGNNQCYSTSYGVRPVITIAVSTLN